MNLTNLFVDTDLLVYMNTPGKEYDKYVSYCEDQLRDNRLFVNIIVLDELLYISRSKYKIPYNVTFEFIDSMIIPFMTVLSLDLDDYYHINDLMKLFSHPNDAFMVASMRSASIETIISEDRGFDDIPDIQRKWLD